MKDFPEQSVKIAKDIAEKYRKRSRSKLAHAAYLYDGCFIEIHYGFNESLKSGNCGRYLHEIVKEAECFSHAGALYLVAREAGLNPKMYWTVNLEDVKEGQNIEDHGKADHAFITCQVSKDRTQIVDPLMHLWGKVRFVPDKNEIEIYDTGKKAMTKRRYEDIQQLSEEDFINKLESHRTPEGGRLALTAAQSLHFNNLKRVYVTYVPNRKEISLSTHVETLRFYKEPYSKICIGELNCPVEDNGKFDLWKDGRFEFYYVSASGWNKHKNPQVRLVVDSSAVSELFDFWEGIVSGSGRKKVRGMCEDKLREILLLSGFQEDFSVEGNSLAERVLNNGFEESFRNLLERKDESVRNFVEESRKDEISIKVLAREARYVRESNPRKNKDNPFGFIYSHEEHLNLLREGLDAYKEQLASDFEVLVYEAAVHARLEKGSLYKSGRKVSALLEKSKSNLIYFQHMLSCRRHLKDTLFGMGADIAIFRKKFDLERTSVEELTKGLDENDLLKAGERTFFHRMISAYLDRDIFSIASYKKGLEKILNRE